MYVINSNTGLLEPSSGGGVNYGDAAELIPQLNQLNGSSQGALPADKLAAALESKAAVASAIEAKGVEVANAPFSEYAAKIREIKAETPKVEGTPGNGFPVRFFDYDGTLLKTHYVHKGEDATPPEVPENELLSFQQWNNDYTNIQGPTDTGAIYTSKDGASYFFISITNTATQVWLKHTVTNGTAVVDWGDGSTDTNDGTAEFVTPHTYSSPGNYVIRLSATDGASVDMSNSFISNPADGWPSTSICREIIFSDFVKTARLAAATDSGIMKISFSSNTKLQNSASLGYLYRVRGIIVPLPVYSIGFRGSSGLDCIVLSASGSYQVNNYALESVRLRSLIIPSSVSAISNNSTATGYIDTLVMRRTTPPTFTPKLSCAKIYVPQGSLKAYQTATNWSAFADIMEEYTEETILW